MKSGLRRCGCAWERRVLASLPCLHLSASTCTQLYPNPNPGHQAQTPGRDLHCDDQRAARCQLGGAQEAGQGPLRIPPAHGSAPDHTGLPRPIAAAARGGEDQGAAALGFASRAFLFVCGGGWGCRIGQTGWLNCSHPPTHPNQRPGMDLGPRKHQARHPPELALHNTRTSHPHG